MITLNSKIVVEEVKVAMGLSVKDSETGRLLIKDREIEIAKDLFFMDVDIEKIIKATGLTKHEFQKEVIDRVKKESEGGRLKSAVQEGVKKAVAIARLIVKDYDDEKIAQELNYSKDEVRQIREELNK